MYGGFNYHVLKTDKGFELVPKRTASLADCYVNVSTFTLADWGSHPDLSADVMAAEKSHLLNDTSSNVAAPSITACSACSTKSGSNQAERIA